MVATPLPLNQPCRREFAMANKEHKTRRIEILVSDAMADFWSMNADVLGVSMAEMDCDKIERTLNRGVFKGPAYLARS